jgi:hypothetical protein
VRRLLQCVGCFALIGATGVAADELRLPAPGSAPWRVLTFPNVARQTRYTPAVVDGRDAVRADSTCAAAGLYFETDVDVRRTPHLSWEWRVDRGVTVSDERTAQGDDFAARVHVTFRLDGTRAGWWQRMRHAVASRQHGYELPGSALQYVWSTGQPPGAAWDNPFATESKTIALPASPLGEWRREEVDVVADYRRLFERDPPPTMAVVLMSDSDNSCQQAVAYFASVRFAGPP